jgi:hypothetical protein
MSTRPRPFGLSPEDLAYVVEAAVFGGNTNDSLQDAERAAAAAVGELDAPSEYVEAFVMALREAFADNE